MSRRSRKSTTTSTTTDSDQRSYSGSGLDVSVSILKLVLQNINTKFNKIVASPDFIPILHYCAISVKRFCKNPVDEINFLLDSASKSDNLPLTEEFFLIEIFIQKEIDYTDNLAEKVSGVYKDFVKDLQIASNKTKDYKFLEGATPKPRGSRQVDDALPNKQLVGIYAKSEIEFWTLILEFQRYSVITYLIQELNSNRMLPFPTEFLQAQFRGSVDAMNIFKAYISNFFEEFFSDERWLKFIEETPELILYIITDVLPSLKPKSINLIGKLYIPFLEQFFDNIFLGKVPLETFINFVYLTGDENFVNVLDTNDDIATEFKEFFLTHFDDLFKNEKWCEFIEGSQLIIQFIVYHMYKSIPMEKHKVIHEFNEKLLDNMLIDEDYKKITQFLSELPIDFLLYQFTSDNPTAQQFKSLFIINFDSYITYKPLYDLILTSDEMLDIVITQVIPLCTETKERKICQDLYESYLKRKLNISERNVQPIYQFVEQITKTVPIEWLRFNNLSSSMQVSLFNYISSGMTPNELANHKNLYTDFYIPFLQVPQLIRMLPETMKTPFYMTIIVPYLTTNTLCLEPIQAYDLACMLAEDPFADQERGEFFQFLVKNVDVLLPIIQKNDIMMKYCWNYIYRSEKELRAQQNKDFIFRFCVIFLQKQLPHEPKLFQLTVNNFTPESFEKNVSHTEKAHIISNLSRCYLREMEQQLSDRLAVKNYQEYVTTLLEKFSVDSYFCQACYMVMTRLNKGFMSVLLNIFSKDKGFRQLVTHPLIFVKFSEIILELFPTLAKNSFFTYDRYEDMLILFNRCSQLISQNDVVREAFLTYFLGNESKLDKFLPCINQPLHKPMFYTEFSDASKNSVLTSVFTTYLEEPNDDLPIHTLWLTYVNAMTYPFIHLKNHEHVIDRVREAFMIPSQQEFDAMWPRARLEDLQTTVYKISKALGLDSVFALRNIFKTLEPGEDNCINEVIEDVVLRYIPESRRDTPEQLKAYEEENPRYRNLDVLPNRYVDFVIGLLGFALIFYLNILGFSSGSIPALVCGIVASVAIIFLSFPHLYFHKLNDSGFSVWFFVRIALTLIVIALSFATYILKGELANHAALIFVVAFYVFLEVYHTLHRIEGVEIKWPERKKKEDIPDEEKSERTLQKEAAKRQKEEEKAAKAEEKRKKKEKKKREAEKKKRKEEKEKERKKREEEERKAEEEKEEEKEKDDKKDKKDKKKKK